MQIARRQPRSPDERNQIHRIRRENAIRETVKVSALIDGKAGIVGDILMYSDALVEIFDQFLNGNLEYLAFDDHPKRFVGISAAAAR